MKANCVTNQGSFPPLVLPFDISEPVSNTNLVVSTEWYTIDGSLDGYTLTPNNTYEIYGILVFQKQTRFLLMDDEGIPGFFPSALFSNLQGCVFFDWEAREYKIDAEAMDALVFVGYPRLSAQYEYLRDLIAGDSAAIADFLRYKEYVNNLQII